MFRVTITIEYWGLEKEECISNGIYSPCKMIYKAEFPDTKSVRQYINYMFDKNTEALSFNVSVKPIGKGV